MSEVGTQDAVVSGAEQRSFGAGDGAAFAAIIAHHSKSFALASKLLPRAIRQEALVLYAWCRRADDAVDLAPTWSQHEALASLRAELDAVYATRAPADAIAREFQRVVRAHHIPRAVPEDLLAGMELDVSGARYADWAALERYCYCVAGTVGLMMCHVMGVHDPRALRHAADLGIAMQLTNICRDVLEDWQRGRLYLPLSLLDAATREALDAATRGELPRAASDGLRAAIAGLLDRAEQYYASGDAGLAYLSPHCRVAIRTARLVYARIGDGVRARGCDPWSGRVVVPRRSKMGLAARAVIETSVRRRYPAAMALWSVEGG